MFHDQFRKAREIFEGKLRMDQYQLIADVGESRSRTFLDRAPDVDVRSPARSPCGIRSCPLRILAIRRDLPRGHSDVATPIDPGLGARN